MIDAHHVLKRPLILTEKGNAMKESDHKYLFEVALDATKPQIREAVQQQFPGVHVEAVHTMIVRGRLRRMGRGHAKTQNWKKAIVTLREGDKIDFFEAY
jgi:large subunit ribosomal protein L23